MAAPRWLHRIMTALFALAACVLLAPIPMFYWEAGSAGNDTDWSGVFSLDRQSDLLIRSVLVAGGAALTATVFGLLVAIAAVRMRLVTRRIVAVLCAASLCVPPYVFAIAWIDLWGPSGWFALDATPLGTVAYAVPGAAFALAAAYYPVIAIAAFIALRRVNPRWREAAAVSGNTRSYAITILTPAVAPPIAAASLLVFLLALYEFPVHSLMQVNTYLVEIHAAASYHDYAAAAALSAPLVICTALVCAAAAALVRRQAPDSDLAQTDRRDESSDRHRSILAVFAWPVIAICSLLPLVLVATRSLPLETYSGLIETAWQEFATSAVLAAVAATSLTLIGVVAALLRPAGKTRAMLDVASVVPYLVSGPLLGLGLIALFNRPGPLGWVYDSAAVLILAWCARFWFVAQWGIGAGLRRQSANGVEAAAVAGTGWLRTQFGVVLAQARPYIAAVWAAAFILTFREIDAAVLVAPAGLTLVSERLFTLMHYGPDQYVMAMALAMSLLLVVLGAVAFVVTRQAARWNNVRA